VVPRSNNKYMCASGTSAACPHVAAGAALLKAWYPAMTNTEMRQWIRDHCRDL
jgi:subtilisin family serine protease